jgi:threonine dehydratase
MSSPITLTDIQNGQTRIAQSIIHTPLERSRWLSSELHAEIWLKLECFQVTGSFKIRGAASKLSSLSETEKSRGILTISAGNHGLAVAHCAAREGLEATVVVPKSASPAKVAAIRRFPVTLLELGEDYDSAERAARVRERETGMTFVSPYNDPEVIAGQGTSALEILSDNPDLEALVVPVGGGGLIAGVLIAAKALKPRIKIYGVEPEASPSMSKALAAGRLVAIEEKQTIADGLAGNVEAGSITFPIIRDLIDGIILVTEEGIRKAIERVAREDHLMIEGAAAASIAGLGDRRLKGLSVAALVTGRNITLDLFSRLVSGKT